MDEKISDIHNKITRERIWNSYLSLLYDSCNKPAKVKVTDVCRRANISRGTFYNHFVDIPDLEDKVNAWLAEQLKPMLADFFSKNEDNECRFRKLIGDIILLLISNKPYCLAMFGSRRINGKIAIDKAIDVISGKYVEWLDRFRPDADRKATDYSLNIAIGGVLNMLHRWVDGGLIESPEYLINLLSEMQRR